MKIFVSGCWLLILFLLNVPSVFAQNTAGSLAVQPNDNVPVDKLFSQLNQASIDSQTNILLKISKYYWYEGTSPGLDSCYIYAIKTRDLSIAQNNVEGKNEANFMLDKVLLSKNNVSEAVRLSNSVYGEERIRLLMLLGEHFLFMPDMKKEHTDRAFTFISSANKLCDSIHSKAWKYPCLLLSGKYFFAIGNRNAGKQSIMRIINDCARTKDIALEAHYWSELGIYMPSSDSTYLEIIHCHEMAVALFSQIGNKEEAAYSLRDVAEMNLFHNRIDIAEQQMLQVISILNSIKSKISFATYNQMYLVYSYKGDYGKSLHYLLLGSALLKPGQWREKRLCYKNLAWFYQYLKMPDRSLYFFKKALAIDEVEFDKKWSYSIACDMIHEQIAMGQQKKAYAWLNNFIKKYPPVSYSDRVYESTSFGELYNTLKMYPQAEKAYLQMIYYSRLDEMNGTTTPMWDHKQPGKMPYYNIGKFYVERQQYSKAKIYLQHALTMNNDNDPAVMMDTEFQLYKANAGLKDFESALHNFEAYTKLNDSTANVTKTKQLEELQIKYQTRENEQSIKLLQNASKYQQAELASSKFQKKVYIGGAGAAVLISVFAFWGYQGKKRSNLKLEAKQIEINRQNGVLQKLLKDKDQLIWDKDSLLSEKELLLREIHHRVKNNLQIIISLLNLQSSYLKNDSALKAIHESQGRIRSIALIHQKLYGSTDVTQIGMNEYIPELINYLGDCLGIAKKNIAINYSIQPLNLDISQAVPIGLIINEAITNSTKYAFVNRNKGEIFVSMTVKGTGEIGLSIADNGKGLASEIDVDHIKTMGLSLIKGLVDQLDGSCEFITNSGFIINLKFVKDDFFASNPENEEAVMA